MPAKKLILIHGFLEDATMWRHILPLLSKKDYVITLPELPGHGNNREIPDEKTAASYCKNLLDQINLAPDDTAFIIAHSMGGYLASSLVTMIPQQVRGLCLFHSKAGADDEQKKTERRRAIEAARENKDLYVRTMLNNTFFEDNRTKCKSELEKMIAEAQKISFETIEASQMVMLQRPDNIAALRDRQFPLYYFIGDHDSSIPMHVVQSELEKLPGAVAHIAHNTGHMGHLERTHEAADFLQRLLRADI